MGERALFDIRRGEGRTTALAFSSLLGVTAAHTLIETARDALFLARVPPLHLPALYITIALMGVLTSRLSALFERRPKAATKTPIDPLAGSLAFAAAVTVGFWAAAAWPFVTTLYALYVFAGMFAAWVAGQLWLRLGALFTVAQAKRLYGAIGSGAVLGAVLGAAAARAALTIVPVRHLLLVAAALLVVTALGPAALLPKPSAPPTPRRDAHASFRAEAAAIAAHPYLSRLLALIALAAMAGTAIDFIFKRHLAATYAAADIAPVLATTALVTNLLSLLAQAVGVAFVVRLFGVQRSLYVMPALLVLGAGAFFGLGLAGVFLLRGADASLRHSLHKTSTELLFVPLPDSLRARAKPIIDLLGQRGGQALVSVVILGIGALLGDRTGLAVGALVLAASIAWIAVAVTLRPRYLDVFRDTLRRGRADLQGDLPALDVGALEALIAALSSRRDAEVLGALDILAAQRRGRLIPSLVLYHPSKAIVLFALQLLVRERRTDIVPVAERLVVEHPDAEVRASALRALAVVEPDPTFLKAQLDATHAELRATALVVLVSRGDVEENEAVTRLAEIRSGAVVGRRALARAIGEVGADQRILCDAVLSLAHDDDDESVRTLATTAMGAVGERSFGPVLVALLADHGVGLAAMEALGVMGDHAIDVVDATLDRADVSPETKWRAVGALARSTSDKAMPFLVRRVNATDDTAVRNRILRVLRTKRAMGVAVPIAENDLLTLAHAAIAAIARALAFRLLHARLLEERPALAETTGAILIQRLLRDKETEGLDRLFLVLAILHPRERFHRIQRGLEAKDAKARASARELLENVAHPSLRPSVLAVVDDVEDDVRLRRIGAPRDEAGYEELIESMIAQGGELGALAAYHAVEAGIRSSMRELMSAMDASGAAFAHDLGVSDAEPGVSPS